VSAVNISASSAVQAAHLVSNGNIDALSGTITGATVAASGPVTGATVAAIGSVSGNNLAAINNITAGTYVDAPQYRLAGVPIAFSAMFAQLGELTARIEALERGAP
jgi:hypothetical protein